MKSETSKNPSISTSSTPLSLVTFLSLVDEYSKSQVQASTEIKASIWNIHKARRSAGSFHLGGNLAFTAHDMREDISARAVLSINKEKSIDNTPDLVAETDVSIGEKTEAAAIADDLYKLHLDGLPRTKVQTLDVDNSIEEVKKTSHMGLRQRKGNKEKEKKIMEELHEWDDFGHALNDSEDPLELFGGLTPPDLKVAQSKAKAALSLYIEAANLVTEINTMMNSSA